MRWWYPVLTGLTLYACDSGPSAPQTGTLLVVTTTSGQMPDPDGYTVALDGGTPQTIGTSDTLAFPDVEVGSHNVVLGGVAANCTVGGGNPRTVTVVEADTTRVVWSVTCQVLRGTLLVITQTVGGTPDPDGYSLALDGGVPQPIGVNDTVAFADLVTGSHSVALDGVAANCAVDGQNPRTVNVSAGDTTRATMSVTCEVVMFDHIAFTSTRW